MPLFKEARTFLVIIKHILYSMEPLWIEMSKNKNIPKPDYIDKGNSRSNINILLTDFQTTA